MNLYVTEPKTSGKAKILTSYGPIEIELWCKECPLACRNFIQLALQGYYDNTIFHRLVPGFVLQGGDPTGTGYGGRSSFPPNGSPFPCEFHPRLRFNRRGLLGMAAINNNNDDDNDNDNDGGKAAKRLANQSQFYFTLDATPELTQRNTLFAKVVGDTIFNVLRMAELQTEDNSDRPLFPPKLLGIEIIDHPFEDLLLEPIETDSKHHGNQTVSKTKTDAASSNNSRSSRTNANTVAKRAKNLLSFSNDDDDDDDESKGLNHSSAKKKPKIQSGSSRVGKSLYDLAPPSSTIFEKSPPTQKPEPILKVSEKQPIIDKNDIASPLLASGIEERPSKEKLTKPKTKEPQQPFLGYDEYSLAGLDKKKMIVGRRPGKSSSSSSSSREEETIAMLNLFKKKLVRAEKLSKLGYNDLDNTKQNDTECSLHAVVGCLSCKDSSTVTETVEEVTVKDPLSWMGHKLSFEKDKTAEAIAAKDARNDPYQLVVIDPRKKLKEIQQSRK